MKKFATILLLSWAILPSHAQVQIDSIHSELDGVVQKFKYYRSTSVKKQPLVVCLHQWSYGYEQPYNNLAQETIAKNWNYLYPDFRGPNNHPKACGSEFVLNDIDAVIDWGIKHLNVDQRKIYVVGISGGGYTALAVLLRSKHQLAAVSAWVPISDLKAWYGESIERKNKYANDILLCTHSDGQLDEKKAIQRSPLYWETPVKRIKRTRISLFAGIHDGFTGSVPITHSTRFYNKLMQDFQVKNASAYVSEADVAFMLKNQSFLTTESTYLGNRKVFYQKKYQHVSITIFDGGHEMLNEVALEGLK